MFRLVAALSLCVTALAVEVPAARVNGNPVSEAEVRGEMERAQREGRPLTRESALSRLILFQLAVQEAKRQELDKRPEVQREINLALYKAYLESAAASRKPADTAVKAYYDEHPMVRLRHLVLLHDTDAKRRTAQKTAKEIQAKLKAGADFKALVLRYSQDESVKVAGDLDYRGIHNLPEVLYRPALALRKNAVTEAIVTPETTHFVQLLDRKAFSAAPAPYVEMLRARLASESEEKILSQRLAELKDKAAIEIPAKQDIR